MDKPFSGMRGRNSRGRGSRPEQQQQRQQQQQQPQQQNLGGGGAGAPTAGGAWGANRPESIRGRGDAAAGVSRGYSAAAAAGSGGGGRGYSDAAAAGPGGGGRGYSDAASAGARGGPRPQQQDQRPQQKAWGQQQTAASVVRGLQPAAAPSLTRPPAPMGYGRATVVKDSDAPAEAIGAAAARPAASATSSGGNGNGNGTGANRGALRGRRQIGETTLRTRPNSCVTKIGTTGERITVQANYFRVLKTPEWTIHQYRVDFAPDVDLLRARRFYLAQHKQLFGGYLFDGTILFSTSKLDDQIELLTKNREGETVQIKIKHVGQVDVSDSHMLQVLNLILRRSMEGLKLQLVGRNFFDPVAKVGLDRFRLEIWPGYTTSIRQHEHDVLLCTEIAHKVMRTDTVYNILSVCVREAADFQVSFKQEVIGMIVITDYNNKTYKISDVDFTASPRSTFETKNGPMSYMDYYKQRYNITIRDTNQPLLISKPTEKNMRGGQDQLILLVPELARATGLTDAMRSNFQLMKAMGEFTRLNPAKRIEKLRVFNQRLQQAPESIQTLNLWNLQLDQALVELPARILPSEKILFGGSNRYICDNRADWTQQFRNNSMYSCINFKRWTVIVQRRNVREVQDFVQMCMRAARGMRLEINAPEYYEMQDDRSGTYSQAIESCVSKDPQILMLVLLNNNAEKYSCIKKKCCVERPVPSQVVTLRTIAPRADKASGLMSIATKVVIQMNAKLMGAPWMVDLPLQGLMTVGFDVCHSPKEQKSYGALVATMDMRESQRYYSAVSQHLRGQELSNEISMNMTYALKAYRDVHGKLPLRILFYRDGVGDGQLHQVVNTELNAIREKLDEIYKQAGHEAGCRMAFIVVSKRINTRYFVNRNNPQPGTVVDDVITLPERYDFYLVSQAVRQGTVSPTSYNVIYDNMGLNADKIQILTYKMTHMYYNWSGTCRVPAVCQYAHKLAFLTAESLQRVPSNVLERQLYFL